jgi:WD40 repeat protein
MAFNPDGTRLFTSDGVTLSAFDTSDWEVATSKPGAVRQGQLFGLTVSPDGAAVVCNGIHGADVLDTATLARRFEGSPTTDEAFAATFTSDGKVLALSGNSGVLLVDPVTARRLSAVTPPGMRLWLGFSPDGTILATSNQTGLQFFSVESA